MRTKWGSSYFGAGLSESKEEGKSVCGVGGGECREGSRIALLSLCSHKYY